MKNRQSSHSGTSSDFLSYSAAALLSLLSFSGMSGYSFGSLTEKKAITRICFLETVAGVPGSIGALVRHLASLRRMKRDGGWINTLFEEAENERMVRATTTASSSKPIEFDVSRSRTHLQFLFLLSLSSIC